MSNLAIWWNAIRGTVIAGLLSIVFSTTPAAAASFFNFKGPTKAPNERICLSFAADQARRHNLQNIKQDNLGVRGQETISSQS